MYTPKSEYKKQEASLSQGFIYLSTRQKYIGPYVQLKNFTQILNIKEKYLTLY